MKIGIDASRAFLKKRTGTEEYSYQVIKHLINKFNGYEVVLYVGPTYNLQFTICNFKLPKNWKIKIIKWPRFWTQIGLSLEMLLHPPNILFVPAHTVPIIHLKKTIVTIHGLEYEFLPEAYSFWKRFYMRWATRLSCRWAEKIIAVSENTKKDLVNLYKVPKEKIKVIYEGYDNQKLKLNYQSGKKLDIRSKFKIQNSKFLLFIGRLEERKNIAGIIKAFEIVKRCNRSKHPIVTLAENDKRKNLKLVLAGKKGFLSFDTNYELQTANRENDIILTGYISEKEKWELLKNAEIFLFPTFYEGFGLPVLEAQSVGAPVIAANNSSIPEITSLNSALLVDPNKPEKIAEAIIRLWKDKNLKSQMILKGRENVKRFSWKKCAEETARVLLD